MSTSTTGYSAHPTDTDATSIDELVADARCVPLPRRPVVDAVPAVSLPRPRTVVEVPESTLSLLQDYAEYGAC
jgi:hypothetical protein